MKHNHFIDKLTKFLIYVLGRQPDEFGLVPDENGFVKIKALIKALGETPGWRHVRLDHIREVIHTAVSPPIELETNRIRAMDRSRLLSPEMAVTMPKLIYYPVRRRAYPVIREKGLPPAAHVDQFVLTDDMDMAQRLGRRIDASPVILIVNSDHARKHGATLWRFGRHLFLSDGLPLGSFSGPPLPKNHPEPKKTDKHDVPVPPMTPGSYLIDPTATASAEKRFKKGSRQRKNEWKRERKHKNTFDWSNK